MRALRAAFLGAALALGAAGAAPAQTVIDDWSKVTLPPPPALKPAQLNGAETALLAMDFTTQTCTEARRPRCAASMPKLEKLLAAARAASAYVIFTVAVPGSVPGDVLEDLAPRPNEPVLPPLGPDKFINSDLAKMLTERGIKTVIATGTQAQTSVLHTASAAALRGFAVVVPVDLMSADTLFPEAYTAWHLSTAARIADHVTLTRSDMIRF